MKRAIVSEFLPIQCDIIRISGREEPFQLVLLTVLLRSDTEILRMLTIETFERIDFTLSNPASAHS